MPNIVLIGMTGSGKSTIGKELSKRLHLSFVDMDEYIEKQAGQSIPDLFTKGEDVFRSLETQACKDLSGKQDCIISTGGGAAIKEENHSWLNKAGLILFIDRPIEKIAADIETEHRPLLKDGKSALFALYSERESLYRELADLTILNDQSLEQTIDLIIKQLPERYTKGDVL
ncbi:MAG: shikimate kinase [Alkalibacterium sp.]|nr:shikimate kinase [Alkalibacterium sp.]